MAKLGKRLRKGARRLVRHRFVQEVLEDLVAAALIAAAAKLSEGFAAPDERGPKGRGRKRRKTPRAL